MKKEKGGILIAIIPIFAVIIVSMGVAVYNTASNRVYNASNQIEQQEKEIYNAAIEKYAGENQKGSYVKLMIEEVISKNNQNIDEYGKFISVEYKSNDTSIDTTDLEDACFEAKYDNSEENVEAATEEMKKLINEISSGSEYEITTEKEDGIIVTVTIFEK